jgi:nitrile hydratase
MGGMHGLGPIIDEPEGAAFHDAWEGRVLALTLASPTRGNIDEGRHQRELIPGPEYLAMTYYEKWFRALTELLVKHGVTTPDELASGRAGSGPAHGAARLSAAAVATATSRQTSVREIAAPPLFHPGVQVRCRNLHPTGHTRLPRYVRGHLGEVVRWHGAHVFPDVHAHGLGEDPRHLYTVRFRAQELWGEAADARDSICLDLWEPYLERA